jgi:acyl-CoA thioester hydrolase
MRSKNCFRVPKTCLGIEGTCIYYWMHFGLSPGDKMQRSTDNSNGEQMLSAYPVITEIVVRWGDMDSLGHVNNIVYLQYFETARIEYHERVGIPAPTPQTGDEGVILAANSCRYRIAVTYPDTLRIGSRVTALGRDCFTMEYAAHSRKLDKIVTEGDALVVMYNYVERRRALVPAELREAIIALEGGELPPVPPRKGRSRLEG